MAKTMTPSTITDGEIDKAGDNLRAGFCKLLRQHRSEFNSDPTQQVLGSPALIPKMLAVFRQMVEAVSGMITRHVDKINRTRAPQQMLDDLGRVQYINREVVEAMPRGQGGGADIHFLPVGRDISDDDLEKEYQSNGWVAADPYLVAAANKEDSAFADEHPNFTHWKDGKGNWNYLACDRGGGGRDVYIDRSGGVWDGSWFVAVVRKESLDS